METFVGLGEAGKIALYATGKKFGTEMIEQEMKRNQESDQLSFEQKLHFLKSAATMAGFYPEFETNEDNTKIFFQIFNCPFKEVAEEHTKTICETHYEFLRGMFEALFDSVELIEKENMLHGCNSCSYHALVSN